MRSQRSHQQAESGEGNNTEAVAGGTKPERHKLFEQLAENCDCEEYL